MHLPAQQFVDGFVDVFAHNVPAGHLDAAQNTHHRNIGPLDKAAAVDAAPDALGVIGVAANHAAFHHVFDHLLDHAGVKGQAVDLAQAFDAFVGDELQKDKVAPAKTGRWVAYDKGFYVGDFHAVSSFFYGLVPCLCLRPRC